MSVILYEKKDKIAFITYNRPEVGNAYNLELLREAERAWVDFRDDPNVWVAIVTGAGNEYFCAGADISRVTGAQGGEDLIHIRRFDHDLEVGKPTIAAVNGWAVSGGFTLALRCDITIAADTARFGLRQPTVGLISDLGSGTLSRVIPLKWAMELLLTCKVIDAQEAYRMGLVNMVVPPKDLMPTAVRIAERICQNAPLAIRAAREMARRSYDLPLSQAMLIGNTMVAELSRTEDYQEGKKAYYEKRKPQWKAK